MMNESEFASLRADMRDHGYDADSPVVLYEGRILDGRNRHEAALAEGLAPVYRDYNGDQPLEYVVRHNLKRRHLTREQRDEVIRKLRAQGMTLQAVADSVGVSHMTVQRASSELTNVNSGIENSRGQVRPTYYAPRQADDDDETDDDEAPHVSRNSGNNEWYTPPAYIAAARSVLGNIDLDPASSKTANKIVGAAQFHDEDSDGLLFDWRGRVWMNPPYASDLIGKFCSKLVRHVATGDVTEAIVLVNNATETAWFAELVASAAAVVFPTGRIKFIDSAGLPRGAPLQGQAVIYFGDAPDKFLSEFIDFGWGARL